MFSYRQFKQNTPAQSKQCSKRAAFFSPCIIYLFFFFQEIRELSNNALEWKERDIQFRRVSFCFILPSSTRDVNEMTRCPIIRLLRANSRCSFSTTREHERRIISSVTTVTQNRRFS